VKYRVYKGHADYGCVEATSEKAAKTIVARRILPQGSRLGLKMLERRLRAKRVSR